jgi:hypothetical protein
MLTPELGGGVRGGESELQSIILRKNIAIYFSNTDFSFLNISTESMK